MNQQNKKKASFLTSEFYLAMFLVIVLLILAVFAREFYNLNNIMSLMNTYSYTLIAAIGMNIIILTSNIDVSTGSLISVVCMVMAAIGKTGAPFGVLLIVAMVVGAALSTANGLLVAKLKIPAIVATLATTQIFQGGLQMAVEGSIYDLPASYTWLAFDAKLFGVVPASVLICLIVTVFGLLFMKYSKFSKKVYAIGNNMNSARLTGINVDKTIILTYAIAGVFFGISATIIGTAGQRVTTTMGSGLEMTFIAAVVLGGTSSAGGSGKVIGTVIGAFILSVIKPAINYLGISADWADAIQGAIIIVSVLMSAAKNIRKKRVIPASTVGGEA